MGQMWAPRDSPASGATRFGHDLTKRRTMETTGWRTRRYRNSRLSPKVRLGWLRPPALRLALRYICIQSHIRVKNTRCPRDGTPVLESICAVPPQSKLAYFLFRSVARMPGIQNGHKNSLEWNERPPVVSFHSNRSKPVEAC